MRKTTFPADFQYLDDIREFVGESARLAGFSEKEIYSIQLATDEACTNIIEHAYGGGGEGSLEITCFNRDDALTIVLQDQGKPFDPSSVPEPNVNADLSKRKVGGLGLYLMRRLMDEVIYETSPETGNILTMVKRRGDDV